MTKHISNRSASPLVRNFSATSQRHNERMHGLLTAANERITTTGILLGFWSMFWLLNGLDKIFNGSHFYGVTRDAKFIDYFSRINLSGDIALMALSSICVVEIILGLSYMYVLLSAKKQTLLTILNFKLSMLIFFLFSAGDILFGDRAELWEHGTFMVLVLVSSLFYLDKPEDEA